MNISGYESILYEYLVLIVEIELKNHVAILIIVGP